MTDQSATPALPLLDELDELRAKATPGPWHVAGSGGIDAGDYDTVIGRGDVDCMSHCYGGTSTLDGDNLPADAALIVAAVNRLPELTAALRAVLALADELGRNSWNCMADPYTRAQSDAAERIRAALASPAPAPQGEEPATPHPPGRCGDPACGGYW